MCKTEDSLSFGIACTTYSVTPRRRFPISQQVYPKSILCCNSYVGEAHTALPGWLLQAAQLSNPSSILPAITLQHALAPWPEVLTWQMNLCNFPFTSLLEEDMQTCDYSMLSDTSTGIFPSPVVFMMTMSCCSLYFTRQHSLAWPLEQGHWLLWHPCRYKSQWFMVGEIHINHKYLNN